jgi:hypothetical protein
MTLNQALLGVLLGGVAVVGRKVLPGPLLALLAIAVLVMVPPAFLRVVTTVSAHRVRIAVPPFWHRVIPAADIVATEIVIADHLVPLFGGWSTRDSSASAMIGAFDGAERSVGNRAVRMTLRSGKIRQVGSWRPHELLAAIDDARGEPTS